MLRSLFSGVSGLKTHQTKMDVIGNNIANVNTYGFKSSRVTFQDVYYQTLSGTSNASGDLGGTNATQIGYGVSVGSIDLLNTRSGFASTGNSMDCYINGEGYFVVKDGSGNEMLTQVGTFSFDGSGNLVDGSTNFVCGYPVDYMYNAASIDKTAINFGKDNGVLLDGYTVNVKYADTPAATATTTVSADANAKTITILYTPSTTDPNLTNSGLQTALTGTWTWAGGATTAPAGFNSSLISIPTATTNPTGTVIATSGLVANTASFDTSKNPQKIINAYGELINTAIGSDGTITGQTKSGKIVVIGQIALANVPNAQALTMDGSSYFKAANNSGTITYSPPGANSLGALKTGGLEMSNVDLSTEFADMIMTQRGFQANSKIITVSDEMLETLVNLKR
jgi:flagellar hook protein FlgE